MYGRMCKEEILVRGNVVGGSLLYFIQMCGFSDRIIRYMYVSLLKMLLRSREKFEACGVKGQTV